MNSIWIVNFCALSICMQRAKIKKSANKIWVYIILCVACRHIKAKPSEIGLVCWREEKSFTKILSLESLSPIQGTQQRNLHDHVLRTEKENELRQKQAASEQKCKKKYEWTERNKEENIDDIIIDEDVLHALWFFTWGAERESVGF